MPDFKLEPDPEPRDSRFHKRIAKIEKMPHAFPRHSITLECGHMVITFGRIELAEGRILCTQCRDLEAACHS